MHKLLLILIIVFTSTSYAGQIVPIVWPFSVGSNQVNFVRAIINEANKQQSKYTFVVEFKAGAGGTVAAQYVANHNNVVLLFSSSSFYTRPEFYPTASHSTADFKPVLIECTGQPYSITSVKYKSINEVRKQKSITIGLGLGSLTEVVARQFKQLLPNTEFIFVPYSGTLQPMTDMLGGNLDLNVDLPASLVQYVNTGKINIIGSSGIKEHPLFPTFASQGINGFEELVGDYQILIKANTDPAVVQELHAILRKGAASSKVLQQHYAADYCTGVDFDFDATNNFYSHQIRYWPAKLKSLK